MIAVVEMKDNAFAASGEICDRSPVDGRAKVEIGGRDHIGAKMNYAGDPPAREVRQKRGDDGLDLGEFRHL